LAHSVGCDRTLWNAQATTLRDRYRVIRYDARGHGRSDAPRGAYTVEQLATDALSVLDAVGAEQAHFCGLSLGGTIGMWLALHRPDRLLSLVLADTAARLGTAEGWQARIDATVEGGTASIADMSMTRFFSDAFRAASPEVVERFRQRLIATDDAGFAGCCAVLRDCDFTSALGRIATPTLVLCGKDDLPTPPADSEILAREIPHSRLLLLDAGHISAVEASEAFTAAIAEHFS
jgi:3-oxoadipate enol-lactonase